MRFSLMAPGQVCGGCGRKRKHGPFRIFELGTWCSSIWSWCGPRWRAGRPLPADGSLAVDGLPCLPGEDLGTFQFGSTVVLLIGGPQAARWQATRAAGPVRVGQRLGRFLP